MEKFKKTIKYLLLSVLGVYLLYMIITLIFFSHWIDFDMPYGYAWVFKASIKSDKNGSPPYSYFTSRDIYNNFHYQDSLNIIVWEFKNLGGLGLDNIGFHQNSNFNDVKFRSGQTINKHSDLEITMRFGFNFNSALMVNLSKGSEIVKEINADNYKGFYGTIRKMSFSNEKGKHQILFDYIEGGQSSLMLFYKKKSIWYLILINSVSPFNEDILNILNLE